jgi:hypothetical protein
MAIARFKRRADPTLPHYSTPIVRKLAIKNLRDVIPIEAFSTHRLNASLDIIHGQGHVHAPKELHDGVPLLFSHETDPILN